MKTISRIIPTTYTDDTKTNTSKKVMKVLIFKSR